MPGNPVAGGSRSPVEIARIGELAGTMLDAAIVRIVGGSQSAIAKLGKRLGSRSSKSTLDRSRSRTARRTRTVTTSAAATRAGSRRPTACRCGSRTTPGVTRPASRSPRAGARAEAPAGVGVTENVEPKPYRMLVVGRRIAEAVDVMRQAGVRREQWRYILTECELFGWREPDVAIVYCSGWADGPKGGARDAPALPRSARRRLVQLRPGRGDSRLGRRARGALLVITLTIMRALAGGYADPGGPKFDQHEVTVMVLLFTCFALRACSELR